MTMKNKYWQIEDFDEFEEGSDIQKKKVNKQKKRKWREIEAYKDRKRERQELASYDYLSLA
jgi:hypothetical protein